MTPALFLILSYFIHLWIGTVTAEPNDIFTADQNVTPGDDKVQGSKKRKISSGSDESPEREQQDGEVKRVKMLASSKLPLKANVMLRKEKDLVVGNNKRQEQKVFPQAWSISKSPNVNAAMVEGTPKEDEWKNINVVSILKC